MMIWFLNNIFSLIQNILWNLLYFTLYITSDLFSRDHLLYCSNPLSLFFSFPQCSSTVVLVSWTCSTMWPTGSAVTFFVSVRVRNAKIVSLDFCDWELKSLNMIAKVNFRRELQGGSDRWCLLLNLYIHFIEILNCPCYSFCHVCNNKIH